MPLRIGYLVFILVTNDPINARVWMNWPYMRRSSEDSNNMIFLSRQLREGLQKHCSCTYLNRYIVTSDYLWTRGGVSFRFHRCFPLTLEKGCGRNLSHEKNKAGIHPQSLVLSVNRKPGCFFFV